MTGFMHGDEHKDRINGDHFLVVPKATHGVKILVFEEIREAW